MKSHHWHTFTRQFLIRKRDELSFDFKHPNFWCTLKAIVHEVKCRGFCVPWFLNQCSFIFIKHNWNNLSIGQIFSEFSGGIFMRGFWIIIKELLLLSFSATFYCSNEKNTFFGEGTEKLDKKQYFLCCKPS